MNLHASYSVLVLTALTILIPAPRSQNAYRDALVTGISHVQQREDFCGEACVEMVLRKLGKRGDQDHVFNMSGLDPALGRGCYSADLKRALERIGFQPGEVFFHVDAARAEKGLEAQWKLLHADLLAGIPSIVCMRYDASPQTTEHMRLVVGYDARSDSVVYLDPADRGKAYRKMERGEFLALWPLKYETARWLVIRFRMEAGDIQEAPAGRGFTNADYAQHVRALNKRLPKGFSLFIERPFVVVGDGPAAEVQSICDRTVRWAVTKLKQDYFARDPDEIITVWLFKDDDSYRQLTQSIFGDTPTTPYGYYSAVHEALIMNIGTGTGTLVHEIVHPFVRANFPRCPAWFNEGLGSLYEQCGERDGHIVGYPNWRLPGLQRAIRAGRVPSFEELTGTSTSEFYADDKGTNYSQARYLCYYLQEQGQLRAFYRDFVANQTTDPTGYGTLKKTLGTSDMDAFRNKWEQFVLKLERR
jgi:hypothetical protein